RVAPRQWWAPAEKARWWLGTPVDVEAVRVGVLGGVAVGRGQQRRHPLAGLEVLSAQAGGLEHDVPGGVEGTLEAQDLLDRVGVARRVPAQALDDVGSAEQQVGTGADQVRRGLGAAAEQ